MEQDTINSWEKRKKVGRAKVPAKLIISGEHAVLYNGRALTCAINLWMKIEIKRIFRYRVIIRQDAKKKVIKLDDYFPENKMDNPICEIYRQFLLFTGCEFYGIFIKIDTEIPSRCGLGSSAALVVGMIKALDDLYGTNLSQYKIEILAKNLENIFHGKSSGIDIMTIIRKGIVSFDNGKVRNYRQMFNKICIIDTGKPQFPTKDVVSFVAQKCANDNAIWGEFYNIVVNEEALMLKGKNISYLIDQNERLLEYIGVVSKKTADFIRLLKRYDIHAKVCGAGTIGSLDENNTNGVIAIFHFLDDKQIRKLKKACKIFKFRLKFAEIVY